MILITGAMGTVGAPLVRLLDDAGEAVRALVRDPAKAQRLLPERVQLYRGMLDDPAALVQAMEQADKLFLLGPVVPRLDELEAGVIDAAKRAGVEHVVKLSAIGADPASPVTFCRLHGRSEARLRDSGLAWTMLRPNFFMQNLLGMAAMIRQGTIEHAAGDARASFIDARDVAAAAAVCLTRRAHQHQIYTLTGPEALGYADVAAIVAKVTGRPVSYVSVSEEAARQSLHQSGTPDWLVEPLLELMAMFRAGRTAAVTDALERITAQRPRTFEQFAGDHADVLRR